MVAQRQASAPRGADWAQGPASTLRCDGPVAAGEDVEGAVGPDPLPGELGPEKYLNMGRHINGQARPLSRKADRSRSRAAGRKSSDLQPARAQAQQPQRLPNPSIARAEQQAHSQQHHTPLFKFQLSDQTFPGTDDAVFHLSRTCG